MSQDNRQALPKLDDPDVRPLADSNHYPEEAWADAGSLDASDGVLIHLRCEKCYQEWPCATRLELRRLGVS